MNSKRIGNIGEAKVLAKFVELGIPVYIPFGDNERADLIAEFNGRLNKVQVKTSIGDFNGQVTFSLTSSTAHRTGGGRHKYSTDEIDFFALYSVARDCVYLLKAPDDPLNAIVIRHEPTRNGQRKGVKMEEDYLIENVLPRYL